MILISILPLPSRKLVLFFGVTIFLSCISCFGHSAFFVVKSTPYDNQMTRIRPILETAVSTSRSADLSLRLVNHWIESLRAIPYSFSQQWRTPSEVETATTADCKGKAVTLYEKMRRSGISNVRLVIGRRSPSSRSTHAWVEWAASDANYILDPTINWFAFRSDDIPKDNYIPFYAYSGSDKFCATPAVLVARN